MTYLVIRSYYKWTYTACQGIRQTGHLLKKKTTGKKPAALVDEEGDYPAERGIGRDHLPRRSRFVIFILCNFPF